MGATKKRRLGDLFIEGEEVTFTDEEGELSVWVQKLNPVESERAMRRANAERAKYLSMKKDQHSEEFLGVLDQALQMSDESIIEFLTTEEMARRLGPLEAELASADEWSKDDYLQGLQDVWVGDGDEEGLEAVYIRLNDAEAVDPEDEGKLKEARRVYSEMKRFADLVDKEADKVRKDIRAAFAKKSQEQLREAIVDRLFNIQADIAWSIEWRKSQLWLGVRDADDHSKLYFSSRDEVDRLHLNVLTRLLDVSGQLEVGVHEGKDSRRTPDSSPQSEPQDKEETADSLQEVAP